MSTVDVELTIARRQLEEAQRLARIGSWEWDIADGTVWWSDELYRIYGLEPGSIEPSYEEFLNYVHPDDRGAVDERNRRAFVDHQPFEDVKRACATHFGSASRSPPAWRSRRCSRSSAATGSTSRLP